MDGVNENLVGGEGYADSAWRENRQQDYLAVRCVSYIRLVRGTLMLMTIVSYITLDRVCR